LKQKIQDQNAKPTCNCCECKGKEYEGEQKNDRDKRDFLANKEAEERYVYGESEEGEATKKRKRAEDVLELRNLQ
jgi:hypothetical protein